MTYLKINEVLTVNFKKTIKFGGSLNVSTSGKKTAPRLYVALPRESNDPDWNGFRIVLGKTIRVEWSAGNATDFFSKKTATESQVVAALTFFFAQV
jgi:hypothetical protein